MRGAWGGRGGGEERRRRMDLKFEMVEGLGGKGRTKKWRWGAGPGETMGGLTGGANGLHVSFLELFFF